VVSNLGDQGDVAVADCVSQIKRDSPVGHFKAKIRQAKQQLTGLVELESQIARRAEIKIEKQALAKVSQPKKRRAPEPEIEKARKEKRLAAAQADEQK
jgi:exonuclease VII large subunit